MRIVIITQDEPFYLRNSLQHFLNLLPKKHQIIGCVVSTVSPFGKQESFLKKADIYYRIKRLTDEKQMGKLFKVMLVKNEKNNFKLGFKN